jgi:nucleoside-diphosphate-sugar epimerase
MKVVITGASGFIGHALGQRLVNEGVEVYGVARPSTSQQRLVGYPMQWHTGDVTKPETLHGLFRDADWVIHAAGLLGRAGVSQATYHDINARGLRHVLEEAVQRGNSRLRVLQISSVGVLGPVRRTGEPVAMDGTVAMDAMVAMDEASPLAPSNAYEQSKAEAEQFAREFAAQGLPVVIGRTEFVYGPGDLHVLGLFRAIQRGIFFYAGNGGNTCHPTYIDDAVEGLLRCLRCGRPGEIYHVTGPRPLTFRELAETIARALEVPPPRWRVPVPLAWVGAAGLEIAGKLTGRPVPLSRTGVAFFSENRRSTSTKAEHELGFVPAVDLEEGIGRTVAWYREQGML